MIVKIPFSEIERVSIYRNRSTYMCVRDTAYSPDDDASAWSKM